MYTHSTWPYCIVIWISHEYIRKHKRLIIGGWNFINAQTCNSERMLNMGMRGKKKTSCSHPYRCKPSRTRKCAESVEIVEGIFTVYACKNRWLNLRDVSESLCSCYSIYSETYLLLSTDIPRIVKLHSWWLWLICHTCWQRYQRLDSEIFILNTIFLCKTCPLCLPYSTTEWFSLVDKGLVLKTVNIFLDCRLFKIDKFVISCSFYLWVGF